MISRFNFFRNKSSKKDNLLALGNEPLYEIFSFLSCQEFNKLMQLNHTWNDLIKKSQVKITSHTPYIFKANKLTHLSKNKIESIFIEYGELTKYIQANIHAIQQTLKNIKEEKGIYYLTKPMSSDDTSINLELVTPFFLLILNSIVIICLYSLIIKIVDLFMEDNLHDLRRWDKLLTSSVASFCDMLMKVDQPINMWVMGKIQEILDNKTTELEHFEKDITILRHQTLNIKPSQRFIK